MNKLLYPLCSMSPVYRPLLLYFSMRYSSKLAKFEFSRQQKFMNKLVGRISNKRIMSPAPNPATLSKTEGEDGKSGRRRVSVLNKLFMRYITDLMVTGDIADMIRGRQLEISGVKMSPNMGMVYVMWIARGSPKEDDTEKVLQKVAGILRHELSQLRVVGVVPAIQFVKDTQYAKIMEVEYALSKADFGEDYEPTFASSKLKQELVIQTKLDPKTVEKIKELEKQDEELEEEPIDEPLPPMRQDVFGLDRAKLMMRIDGYVYRKDSLCSQRLEDGSVDVAPRDEKQVLLKFLKDREKLTRRKEERLERSIISKVSEDVEDMQKKKYFLDDDVELYGDFDEDENHNDDQIDVNK